MTERKEKDPMHTVPTYDGNDGWAEWNELTGYPEGMNDPKERAAWAQKDSEARGASADAARAKYVEEQIKRNNAQ
jgi:hypothetical protein